MPDPSRHADSRNIVESIVRYIPGFRGYLEKEYRRDSDQLSRNWMADRLQHSKRGLDDYMRKMVDAGQIDGLPECDRFKSRMDGLISRLRGDVQGYSGLFDYVRIREAELDRVYELDHALMNDVDQLAGAIEQLAVKPDAPSRAVGELQTRLAEVENKYKQRGEILEGLSEA